MRLHLTYDKRRGVFKPHSPHDADRLEKLPDESFVQCDINRPRSQDHHRKFFAMVAYLADLLETDKQTMLEALKVVAGHCTAINKTNGDRIYIGKSISFATMSQDDFAEFYRKCVDAVIQDLLPHQCEPSELERQIDEYMAGFA